MNITPIQNNNQNKTSFKMNLKCADEATENALKKGMEQFYNGCLPEVRQEIFGNKPLNSDKLYKNLQNAFEKMTKKIHGTTTIKKAEPSKNECIKDDYFTHSYTDPSGKEIESNNRTLPFKYLPNPLCDNKSQFKYWLNKLFDNKSQFKPAVTTILADLSDLTAKTGVGFGKENKFHQLFEKLIGE